MRHHQGKKDSKLVKQNEDEEYVMAVEDFKSLYEEDGRFVRQPWNDKKDLSKKPRRQKQKKLKGSAFDAEIQIHLLENV
ncbi:hypothetical protein Tco_0741835 [Tanacetum coccineum]